MKKKNKKYTFMIVNKSYFLSLCLDLFVSLKDALLVKGLVQF